ncbi:translation factor [Punctularia strigosozonata HHB-11173 SS5]|uniref:translation factor n=1 Tax=Punctularia strigosozonata (strain HHB-11173) TaxID=741275 RepID=UPI000441665F|nr:translation factor [Punctularia strigosozonata HHB-11173 SS5]EIN10922.1 translation factor [Punctularia strigosozonata HHB-11173 SS5]
MPLGFQTTIKVCDCSAISFPPEAEQPTVSSPDTLEALTLASRHLVEQRECVVFPTETVYGLGALALDADAASKIYSTKGRPADNPLIVHISSLSMLQRLLPPQYNLPKTYEIMIKRFWPGPLTLLFPSDPSKVPSIITAGQPTVAIRMPSHPVARSLIAIADAPLAAPSANSSGKPSPTRAEHVYRDLNGKVDIILDGGPCDIGLESTVVDGLHEDGAIRVLRPGGVTVEDIENAVREGLPVSDPVPQVLVHKRDFSDEAIEQAPTTPGMKYRHYSPSVGVTLVSAKPHPADATTVAVDTFLSSITSQASSAHKTPYVGLLAPEDSPLAQRLMHEDAIRWRYYPLGPLSKPAVSAHRLFDGLLTLDKEGVDFIVVEALNEEREGLAIMNRIRKAASSVVCLS